MSSKTKTTATKEEVRPALVPKLRFPEFRGAEGWNQKRLGSVGQLTRGLTYSSDDVASAGVLVLRSTNIQNGNLVLDRDLVFVGKPCPDALRLQRGDIVICMSNGSKALVGKSGEYSGEYEGDITVGAFCSFFRPTCPFAKIAFHLNSYQAYIANLIAGGNINNLTNSVLEEFRFPIPYSPAEQRKIAGCLSSVDDLMAAQARKVDALKTHKKGLMQQLFPREGETQPRLRFPEFQNAGEWEESPLSKFILSLDAGVSVNSGDRPAGKTEFGVLKTSTVTNGVFEPDENKVVFAESEQSRLKEPVRGGTIIISRMNTPALVGANAYVESSHENLFLPDRLWAAKPKEGVSMRFLAFILGSDKGRAALSKLAKGSSGSMKNITKPEVLAFSVMAPSPAEQQRIASCLSSLDALITLETQKLDALKTHKKGLMQQLFPSPEGVAA
jgi:type I restriction enzyme S subunit